MAPASARDAELLAKIKVGKGVRCDVKTVRNYAFHKKFFAMINFLFGIWEETMPRQMYRGRPIHPNIDKFRRDLTILTGRFDATYNVRGEVQLEAHSISFGSMEEHEFEALYSDVINVALDKVLSRPDLDEERVRAAVEELLRYDQ